MNADAQAYRSAIEFGQKKQQEQLGLLEENARLRAALDGHHAAWATKWENCSICRASAGKEVNDG
jgi:hypothetical protein